MSITTYPKPARTASQSFNETVDDLKHGADSATAAYGSMSEKAAKTATDLTAFNRGTLEALAQAGQIFAAESQDLIRQMTEAGQAAFTESLNNLRAIAAAKTVKERLELQANFVRTSAISAVSEGGRFARAGIDLAEKASAPITARAYLAAETFVKPIV
jgi:hypothetical protein